MSCQAPAALWPPVFCNGSEEALLEGPSATEVSASHTQSWLGESLAWCFMCRPGMSRVKHEGLGYVSTPGSGHSGQRLSASLPPKLKGSHRVGPAVALSYPLCLQQYQNGESEESHEQFLKALQNAVSTFVNRMKSNHMRGRSITNDSAVLSLFQSINSMHPQLLELLNQLDERRRRCPPVCPPCACVPSKGHANDPLGPWDT